MAKSPPPRINKVLMIKNDKIGDMILSTNIFREFKKNLPKSEITVIASKANKSLIEKNKNISRILIADYPPTNYKALINYLKTLRLLRKQNFDLGIDLRGSIFNILFFLTLSKVKYKAGFYNRKLSKFLLDFPYKKDRISKHVTYQRIDLMNKALGFNSKDYWPEIQTSTSDQRKAQAFLKKHKLKKFISVIPDASVPSKQWSMHNFDKTIKHFQKQYPKHKILLLGIDTEKISFLHERNPNTITTPPLNLRVVHLILKESALVLCHDGGIMHLAWPSRVNLIALIEQHLGGEYYKPLNRNAINIVDKMHNISPQQVQDAADKLLNPAKK
jgi:ADP-heptose:LPS heptosyltransferase